MHVAGSLLSRIDGHDGVDCRAEVMVGVLRLVSESWTRPGAVFSTPVLPGLVDGISSCLHTN
jgi:hypothetical protein